MNVVERNFKLFKRVFRYTNGCTQGLLGHLFAYFPKPALAMLKINDCLV